MPTIKKPNQHFDATLYTGNGSAQSITNAGGFQPDLVWQKPRSEVASHRLVDSVRGVNKSINSNQTDAEATDTNTLTAFNSNGFTGGGSNAVSSGQTAIAWQWKAGGATTVNTSGSISSNVSVNTTAGFSIVTYTGTGSAGTVGHGLGVAPSMIFIKTRSNIANWYVGHSSLTSWVYAIEGLNTSNGQSSQPNTWNSTAPTSTVFSLGTEGGVNTNTRTYVAYCWAEIAGFSKFGSYTGNGSTDGPFVYLGFRPKFILFKTTSTVNTNGWVIMDTVRNTYNYMDLQLYPHLTNVEAQSSTYAIDAISNGFKIRNTNAVDNNNGDTFIYAAFAESPFKYANAK
jgi:hypothetical protein